MSVQGSAHPMGHSKGSPAVTDERMDLAARLRLHAEELPAMRVVAGFDGFVDQIVQIVAERQDLDSFTPVPTISAYAELMRQAAGRSSLREFVVRNVDPGGCAVNLGDGMISLGVPLEFFGTLGQPPHPVFAEFAARCRRCTSWEVDPGFTMAMEFQDGKSMLSSVSQLAAFAPGLLERVLADGKFAGACAEAELVAITNWTLFPHMTDCWRVLQDKVFAHLTHRPWFFLDLVDPRSRSEADIRAMLPVLSRFEAHGRCVLGGNLNEGNVLATLLGLKTVPEEGPAVAELCDALRKALEISEVAIHCVAGGAVASEDGVAWVTGPYTPTPVKSTGAGDRYNAGYCLGRLLGLPPRDRCLTAAAAAGFFVRNARSATIENVCGLLEQWAAGSLAG